MSIYFRNYYSTNQQYSELQRRAFDEGPAVRLNQVGINSSSIETKEIDPFRQGVEITQEKHSLGIYKISAGTPGHIVKPLCFGINELDIVSSKSYVEIEYFDPVEYLRVQEPGKTLKKIFTFPIVTGDSNQQENYGFNGIIEPFSIRPVISFFSIEFPFESRSVKGSMMGGNSDQRKFSSDQILTVDYYPDLINEDMFLDAFETVKSGSGVPQQTVGYISDQFDHMSPYSDGNQLSYLKSLGITAETHGQDMVNAFTIMTGSSGNYVPPGKKSNTSGFIYDSIGYAGVDSLAFGGLSY